MKYKEYDILDFLSDDFFIQWVRRPDDNTRHFWEKWIKENPEKRKEIMEAISIIRNVKYPRTKEMNDKMYVETFENILNAEKHRGKGDGFSGNHHFLFIGIKNMAAFLIILFCCLLAYQHMMGPENLSMPNSLENLLKKSKAKGKKSMIKLADQSRIFLNGESEIQYPGNINIGDRWVKLKGEALFENTENGRPFRVFTSETEIKVLGTSFNVKEEDDELSVALLSGKVQVRDGKGNQVQLQPTEMLILKEDGKMYKTGFDSLETIGWKDKELVFNSNIVHEVKRKIEKWYDVTVSPKATVTDHWVYSGVYQNESLENVLKGIFITSGMKFSVQSQQKLKYN